MASSSAFTEAEREEIILSAMKNRGLRRDAAEKLIDSIGARTSKRNPLLERQWVRTLVVVTDDLREDRAHPIGLFATVFWVRLYGVITELRSRFQTAAGMQYDLLATGRSHPWLAAAASVFEACTAIRDSLSDDELVFAAFSRHVHAHVYQEGFEYSIERGNPAKNQPPTLRTKQMVRTVRRHLDVDQVHEIVDHVSAKYAHDPARIVVNFAHIVGSHVERLGEAMNALEVERERDRAETVARAAANASQPAVAADPATPGR